MWLLQNCNGEIIIANATMQKAFNRWLKAFFIDTAQRYCGENKILITDIIIVVAFRLY
jgi:hypothetical protein